MAGQVIDLNDRERLAWGALGAAHYRAGDYREAHESLQRMGSPQEAGDDPRYFWFAFIGPMALVQLSESEPAEQLFAELLVELAGREPLDPLTDYIVRRSRAEAAVVLERGN